MLVGTTFEYGGEIGNGNGDKNLALRALVYKMHVREVELGMNRSLKCAYEEKEEGLTCHC